MTALQAAPGPTGRRRGRGLVIAGGVLLVVSVLGGLIGVALTVGRLDRSSLDRDVVRSRSDAPIPGRLPFSVAEPLPGTADRAMTVGVAISSDASTPTCALATAAGESVRLSPDVLDSTPLHGTGDALTVVSTARLSPGDYVASCAVAGEPSASPRTGRFTVVRALGAEDVHDLIVPMAAFLGVLALAALLFVLGTVLLIVGLVLGRRGPPAAPPPGMAAPWGPQVDPTYWGSPPAPPAPPPAPPAPPGPSWPTPPGQR